MSVKVKTARLSIFSNTFLIILKVVAGIISGSVSIISEAIHSAMDLIASVIAFFSVKYSDAPPDAEHPYGHGKFENVSGVIEAVLIFIAAGWIIYEAVHKLITPSSIENAGIGSVIMAISAIVNFLVSKRLYRVARETDSIALEADALHLKTDVLTSAGVSIALVLISITGWGFIDPAIAILVALMILRESYILMRNAFSPLIDTSLSAEETRIIRDELKKRNLSFHNLRTRRSGQFRFADLHLELPENMSLKDVHRICDEIEAQIELKIARMNINIHVEPTEKAAEGK